MTVANVQDEGATSPLAEKISTALLGMGTGALIAFNAFPSPQSLGWFVFPVLFGLVVSWRTVVEPEFRGRILSELTRFDIWRVALILCCISMVWGYVLTDGPIRPLTYFEFLIGLYCILSHVVACCLFRDIRDEKLASTSMILIIVAVVAISAPLAIYKYVYLLGGGQLGFIEMEAGDFYPWGTSLRMDSNFFTIPSLVFLLFVGHLVSSTRKLSPFILTALVVSGTLAAYVGVNAASRRFVVLLGIGLLVVVAAEMWNDRRALGQRLGRFFGTVTLVVAGCLLIEPMVQSGALVPQHPASESSMSEQAAGEAPVETGIADIAPNPVSGVDRLSTIASSDLYESRLVYLDLSIEMLRESNLLLGEGYSYQRRMACITSQCVGFDYPHFFVISHTLFAGTLGMVATLLVLSLVVGAIIRGLLSPVGHHRLLSTFLLVITGFATTSGDTVFSTPALCALPALLPTIGQLGAKRA